MGNGRSGDLSRGGEPGTRCAQQDTAYRSSTGRAVTAPYVFARWLQVQLASFVYSDAAAAQRAAMAPEPSQQYVCLGRALAEELRREGYVGVEPQVFPVTAAHIADGAASLRIEVTSRYRGRVYDWDFDYTSVRRGAHHPGPRDRDPAILHSGQPGLSARSRGRPALRVACISTPRAQPGQPRRLACLTEATAPGFSRIGKTASRGEEQRQRRMTLQSP